MFPKLQEMGNLIEGKQAISALWDDPVFAEFSGLNVLPLIYDEKKQRCNILVFDHERAQQKITKVVYENKGKGRKHPVYRFYDNNGDYVCEVRYGSGTANALQRGLWTHTKNGLKYFDSLTDGWISFAHNLMLLKLFSHALIATSIGHEAALEEIKKDIELEKQKSVHY